ncbi:MAG: hypothetical protein VZQ78_11375, partial [Prevotella sp.]|nr:hypothetical protein [Prevotella sp.]
LIKFINAGRAGPPKGYRLSGDSCVLFEKQRSQLLQAAAPGEQHGQDSHSFLFHHCVGFRISQNLLKLTAKTVQTKCRKLAFCRGKACFSKFYFANIVIILELCLFLPIDLR